MALRMHVGTGLRYSLTNIGGFFLEFLVFTRFMARWWIGGWGRDGWMNDVFAYLLYLEFYGLLFKVVDGRENCLVAFGEGSLVGLLVLLIGCY